MTAITTLARTPQAALSTSLHDLLADLYVRQIAAGSPIQAYLEEHSRPATIHEHVEVFQHYLAYLPGKGAVLDWGCNHAPDSCLLRAARGSAYDLYGCDFLPAGGFDVFHDFAGLDYRPVENVARIPFEDGQFDAVIGSGTLEHTAMDYEALKEVYRVLKPDGVFIASYLPNRLSYEEFLLRRNPNRSHHRRLYGLADTRRLLLHTGFHPLRVAYQIWGWESRARRVFSNRRLAAGLAAFLQTAALVPFRCSTLFAVGRKVVCM